jgi:hypothetical protein
MESLERREIFLSDNANFCGNNWSIGGGSLTKQGVKKTAFPAAGRF